MWPFSKARTPSINITITPDCVVRPGDVVIVPTSVRIIGLTAEDRASIVAQIKARMPDGATPIFVPMQEPLTPINLSRLLSEVVEGFCGKRANNSADHSNPENGVSESP